MQKLYGALNKSYRKIIFHKIVVRKIIWWTYKHTKFDYINVHTKFTVMMPTCEELWSSESIFFMNKEKDYFWVVMLDVTLFTFGNHNRFLFNNKKFCF